MTAKWQQLSTFMNNRGEGLPCATFWWRKNNYLRKWLDHLRAVLNKD